MSTIETIYLIHHSHTDIGYTHDQIVLWDLYGRFLDEALLLAERYVDDEDEAAFRWTVETTMPLMRWLDRATQGERDRFVALERAGRIEVTGMQLNVTPLYDGDQLIESLQNVGVLRRELGFTIRHAMNCDVNGQNWPIVDLLLDAGIEGFSMAINNHFGGPLRPRPYPFLWQAPSGRTLPTYNGWTYDKGWNFGIGREDLSRLDEWWPLAQNYLNEINYPLPILMIQSYHPFGDNGSAFDFTPFLRRWNQSGRTPRIVMATPTTWWKALAAHREELDIWRGDWTDFWNFGAISSTREESLNRQSRSRLRTADALHAALHPLLAATAPERSERPFWAGKSYREHRSVAWDDLNLWDEHTWGADKALRSPWGEDAASQWHQKAHYAYAARSRSLLLQRDGIADLARFVARPDNAADVDTLLLMNPLPWEQTLAGAIRPQAVLARGFPEDGTAGRHHLDRRYALLWHEEDGESVQKEEFDSSPNQVVLPPTRVPGYGYVLLSRSDLLVGNAVQSESADAAVENHRFRMRVDPAAGGVVSLYDKALDWEWVAQENDDPLHGFVYEEVADREHPWPRSLLFERSWLEKRAELADGWRPDWPARRQRPTRVRAHRLLRTHLGWVILQTLEAPGIDGLLTQRIFLPDHADWVECSAWWRMSQDVHPSATYLLFPFQLPNATPRYDVGGQPVIPDREQLPGSCRDYFTVQGWVDFSNSERGVTIATPDNPLVQLGGFHFGQYQQQRSSETPTLLGWVTNNYWETNFRAHQPGMVYARYRINPHEGDFQESQAHRWGLEAMNHEPLLQHLGEPPVQNAPLASQGALLELPQPPVLVQHIKPGEQGRGLLLRMVNAGEKSERAVVGSGVLSIERARLCDLFGQPHTELPVADGAVGVELAPRRTAVLQIDVEQDSTDG